VRGTEAVDQEIVDEGALGRQQPGVLRLPHLQLRRVVGRDALDRRQGVLAGDLDLSHMTDVEHAGAGADGIVLDDDARVLDGHVPAAEWDHLRAGGAVTSVERRFLERCLGRLFHEGLRS
jgi:hypothetical protein